MLKIFNFRSHVIYRSVCDLFCFQIWIASPNDCGEARCPIPFDSELFVAGTFTTDSGKLSKYIDLCFVENVGNDINGEIKRHGLCAIPVAMVPRTPLPPSGMYNFCKI